MPVERFRSLDEARRALVTSPPAGDLCDRIASLWKCSVALSGYTPPRGVQRFRNMEEAAQERNERTRRRMAERARELGLGDLRRAPADESASSPAR